MAFYNLVMEIALQNKELVAKGAFALIGAGVGALGGFATAKKEDAKIIQEEKEISYEHGLRDGAQISNQILRETIIEPMYARIALAHYIARIDGSISKMEKQQLQNQVEQIVDNPEIPEIIKKEVKKIANDRHIDYDKVVAYLDKSHVKALPTLISQMIDIARLSDGITEEEQQGIDLILQYAKTRLNISDNDLSELEYCNYETECDNADILEDRIQDAVNEYGLKMKMLDYTFSRRTRLNMEEIGLMMFATALQCARIYLVNYLTTIEKAGKGKRESFLHEQQEKMLKHFDKGKVEKADKYYAPLNQIIATSGVPYDTTRFSGEKLDLFKGANHRFTTLGHDPIIGMIVGTSNIMTNTITTINDLTPIPVTYHVQYDPMLKNPGIGNKASLGFALNKVVERSKEDITPLVASFIKQLIHIATDLYTPAGIQLPGAHLLLNRSTIDRLTAYVSSGTMIKIVGSAGIDILINKLIELLHGCMLLERNSNLDDKIYQVKTKKIVDYSNAIATGSNFIRETITGNYQNLDWAGALILLRKSFSDINFLYEVKREFIRKGLGEA